MARKDVSRLWRKSQPDEIFRVVYCTANWRDGWPGKSAHSDYSSKLNEAQKYISMSGHVYVPAYLTAGSRKWEKLSPDVRKILEETAIEVQAYAYEMGAKGDSELLGKITASGKTASNEVDKKAFAWC